MCSLILHLHTYHQVTSVLYRKGGRWSHHRNTANKMQLEAVENTLQ